MHFQQFQSKGISLTNIAYVWQMNYTPILKYKLHAKCLAEWTQNMQEMIQWTCIEQVNASTPLQTFTSINTCMQIIRTQRNNAFDPTFINARKKNSLG